MAISAERKKNHLFEQHKWNEEIRDITNVIGHGITPKLTAHAYESLTKRGLRIQEVLTIFENGTAEIVQKHDVGTYPFAYERYNTEVLYVIYGKTNQGDIIHMVVSITLFSYPTLKLITTYLPSLKYFEEDYKTLRSEYAFRSIK